MDGCTKNFSNPSSLRIHRLLDHESPDSESATEKALRDELTSATNELERHKEELSAAQQTLTTSRASRRAAKMKQQGTK